jgi:hypothetical protein
MRLGLVRAGERATATRGGVATEEDRRGTLRFVTEQKTYSDFDLMIEGTGEETYRARVLDSPAGGAAGSFSLPFSTLELENFLLKVGRPRRGTRRLESPEMEAARHFGRQLFDAVFQDDVRLSLRRSLDEVERRDEGLRIRLWFSDAPELASLPWEFLYSESEDQFLVLSAWTPIVRYLDLTQRVEPLTVTGPLRILAMISSPHDYPTLDVEEEWRRIEDSLRPLIDRGVVTIDRSENATLLELQHKLRANEYHIFHFLGHGGFDEKSDDGVLVMEDGHNRSRLVTGRDLGTILSDHRSLRLAVLNACEGARASDEDPFSGAAQSLIRKGIPAVVAMQFEITDDAAIAFAHEFYGAIADAYPVDAAIGEARRAIFGLGNDIEWGTPVVYLRGDGQLFEVQPTVAAADAVVVGAVALDEAATDSTMADGFEVEAVESDVEAEESDADEAVAVVGTAGVGASMDQPAVDQPITDSAIAEESEVEADELDVDEVVGAAGVGGSTDQPAVEEAAQEPSELPAEDAAPAAPADATTSRQSALTALPPWVMWTVVGVAAVVVLVVAISIFSGGGEPEVATTAATGTTLEAVTPTTVFAADGEARAQRTAQPKVIDGRSEDWTEGTYHTTDHVIFNAAPVRDDPSTRAGEENLSEIRLAWDDTYLYVFADVDDDILVAPATDAQIWQFDAVNLNITVGDVVSEEADEDDRQLTLSPGDPSAGTGEASAQYIPGKTTLGTGFADVAAVHGPGHYALEARIPWSEIDVADPQAGDRFQLSLMVFDNDGEPFAQAEIKANTPPGGEPLDARWFRSPQTWGTLTLEE